MNVCSERTFQLLLDQVWVWLQMDTSTCCWFLMCIRWLFVATELCLDDKYFSPDLIHNNTEKLNPLMNIKRCAFLSYFQALAQTLPDASTHTRFSHKTNSHDVFIYHPQLQYSVNTDTQTRLLHLMVNLQDFNSIFCVHVWVGRVG